MDGVAPVAGFGGLLKYQRERTGLTQQCLADHASLSVRAVRDMEAGRVQRPRQETVRLVADALGLRGRARSLFEAAARQRALVEELAAPPAPRGAIIGREAESETLTQALTGHGDRLLSLVGLGGVGKSRLALDVAWRVHHTARWSVRWAACGEPQAGAARAPFAGPAGTTTAHGGLDGLTDLIEDRPTLLVLDGADDTVGPAVLDELFRRCPELRVLLTSRAPLGLDGEQVVPLAPLAVPGPDPDPERAMGTAAVRLLLAHMRRLRPGLALDPADRPEVAALCRYLDGLPRALEYAAGWTLLESPARLLDRLAATPFSLPAPPVTLCERGDLRDTLDEANRRLTDRQRELLVLLAAEPGDWSVEEAAAVSGRPLQDCRATVQELLLRGLVRLVPAGDGARFAVLNLLRTLCREHRGATAPATGDRTARPPHLAALAS
ncbi:helix-turn-helix domain-containing protein [Kitasatospora sp. NPDC089509]|uniref:helix-turn-helix domain-containing protein n=1 Tax=Kitasatospora sp. NPDC089509 TaxID=3364079 RepID=UPI003816B428